MTSGWGIAPWGIEDDPPAADTTAPTVQNLIPVSGVLPTTRTPIEFDVVDVDPGLAAVIVTVKFRSEAETWVVWDGFKFLPPFEAESARTDAIEGFHFSILPTPGWPDFVEDLRVYAIDQAGNLLGIPT